MYTVPIEDQGEITEVRVFDFMGHDITTLVSDIKPAGRHAVEFDGSALRAGAYVIAVHCHSNMQSKKLIVVR